MENWEQYRPKEFQWRGVWIFNWFSNMITWPFVLDNIRYKSVENYYQAHKTEDKKKFMELVACSPEKSKMLAKTRNFPMRPNWHLLKIGVMRTALKAKIEQNPDFKAQLLATEGPIIEWNNWSDRFWGVEIKDNLGHNNLGKLLTELRDEYK